MANKPSAEELKKNLSEMQFYVTQNHGTEPPFTGRLLHNKRDGVYHCLICDAPLFHSQTKYDSGCNSLLILPAAAARNLARSSRQYLAFSVLIAMVCGVGGLIASFYFNTSAGATIVLLCAAVFFATYAARRRK